MLWCAHSTSVNKNQGSRKNLRAELLRSALIYASATNQRRHPVAVLMRAEYGPKPPETDSDGLTLRACGEAHAAVTPDGLGVGVERTDVGDAAW